MSNDDSLDVVAKGAWGSVLWAVDAAGRRPAKDFYEGLSSQNQAKVLALFQRLAEVGQVSNREKFKQLGPKAGEQGKGLWEFKSHQIRMIGDFKPGYRFFLAHGTIKKQDRLDKADIERAVRILREHDSRK